MDEKGQRLKEVDLKYIILVNGINASDSEISFLHMITKY